MNKDSNCIFCKIINKEIPAEIVYEDNSFVAFLDQRPRSPGHVLVLPRDHYRWVWDVPNAGEYFEIIKKITHAQRKAFKLDLIQGKVEGKEVPHAHFWIYPDSDKPWTKEEREDIKGNAEKIRANL